MKKLAMLVTAAAMSVMMAVPALAAGWVSENNAWYYVGDDGAKKTGWIQDGEAWYYLGEDGKMWANSSTPDGYFVGPNGAWVQGAGSGAQAQDTSKLTYLRDLKPARKKLYTVKDGATTAQGIQVYTLFQINACNNSDFQGDGLVEYKVEGRYTRLQSTVCPSNELLANTVDEVKVYGDNDAVLYTSGEITSATQPFNIDLDVTGQNVIRIEVHCTKGRGNILFTNTSFTKK